MHLRIDKQATALIPDPVFVYIDQENLLQFTKMLETHRRVRGRVMPTSD